MFSRLSFSKAFFVGLSLFMSFTASAGFTQVSVFIDAKNACGGGPNGYFAGSFNGCQIIVGNVGNQYVNDVIIKYKDDLSFDVKNDDYSINGSDINFTNPTSENTSGTWTYSGGYPDIRFWLAKASTGFNLFWMVDSTEIGNNCVAGKDTSNLSFACMSLAQSVTTGTWSTPLNTNLSNKGLSHLTFFGGLCRKGETRAGCGTTTTTEIPEPSSIALFALALFGLVARRKIKS